MQEGEGAKRRREARQTRPLPRVTLPPMLFLARRGRARGRQGGAKKTKGQSPAPSAGTGRARGEIQGLGNAAGVAEEVERGCAR